jgi:hypothetical protein
MVYRSDAGTSPPIHWPIIGSEVLLRICMPGNCMHPAMSMEQKIITEMVLPDRINEIE